MLMGMAPPSYLVPRWPTEACCACRSAAAPAPPASAPRRSSCRALPHVRIQPRPCVAHAQVQLTQPQSAPEVHGDLLGSMCQVNTSK
jgi:hypothetical protein